MSRRILLLLFCVIIGAQSSSAPNLILCKQDDFACLTKNANLILKLTVQGVPELNIENLEPIHQDLIQGDLDFLKYKLFNSTLKGSKNCDIVTMKLDLKKSTLNLDIICPFLDMYGLYETSGTILGLHIEGTGDYRIQCKEYYFQVDTDLEISQNKEGRKYMSLKNYKVNGELKGGMMFNLTNLFDGKQKELAESVILFMNTNWKSVAKELQWPVFSANFEKLIKNFNKYLKIVPMDQIFVDL